jgi:sugar fermentation stimulation protein A
MRFASELVEGRLLRRYKRFLADVRLKDGREVTAHTANPGTMMGLTEAGRTVFLQWHDNPKRKLPYSWELLRIGRYLVGVNPMLANRLVEEAITDGIIEPLAGYASLRREVRYGTRGSRVDLMLEGGRPTRGHPTRRCYVEVKNATLLVDGTALFPDAVTERGRKHLLELGDAVRDGHRAVLCFTVQRGDALRVAPADAIDPAYGAALRRAAECGVEILAYRAEVRRRGIRLRRRLDVLL